MDLMSYIDKGGIIVYILITLNIIGFTIILIKAVALTRLNKSLQIHANNIVEQTNSKELVKSKVLNFVKSYESGLSTVKNIATIAPLLGLLGTVIGVLEAFDAISKSGLGDPSVFSHGISIALITTIAGLIVAIPHYICYNYFIGILDTAELKLNEKVLEQL
jgi:biopolymer transport protein ExbB